MLSCFPLGYFFYDSYNYIWSLYWIIQFYNKNAYSLVRFILNKTHLNQRNMMQICVIMVQRKACFFFPNFLLEKSNNFTFYLRHNLKDLAIYYLICTNFKYSGIPCIYMVETQFSNMYNETFG